MLPRLDPEGEEPAADALRGGPQLFTVRRPSGKTSASCDGQRSAERSSRSPSVVTWTVGRVMAERGPRKR